MNRYFFIRRLRWPAILLLIGVVELLHQTGLVSRSWHYFWPLLLIMIGVLLLAERAALASDEQYPYQGPYPGAPYGAPPFGNVGPNAPTGTAPQPGSAIVPSQTNDFGSGSNGGQQ